ncbi:MAG: hypothetical protein KAT79_02960 [candidate division Zixibacteria bacterium]|nr:hypothetical protein [candidate division Zixibacteria bacterium]
MRQFLLFVVLIALLAGCGPKVSEEKPGLCVPYDLQILPDHEKLTVVWKNDCATLISGYNIFIGAGREADKPFNTTVYPGDTNPDDGVVQFEANGLANGVRYFVSVRTVFPDQTESALSEPVLAACGVREEIALSVRYKSQQDGYSFEEAEYVRANDLANDLYYLHKDGKDYLGSPARLDGFLRGSKFAGLDVSGEYELIWNKLSRAVEGSLKDRIAVGTNQWIRLETADGANAFMKVLGFSGEGADRQIKLFVAYSSVRGEVVL